MRNKCRFVRVSDSLIVDVNKIVSIRTLKGKDTTIKFTFTDNSQETIIVPNEKVDQVLFRITENGCITPEKGYPLPEGMKSFGECENPFNNPFGCPHEKTNKMDDAFRDANPFNFTCPSFKPKQDCKCGKEHNYSGFSYIEKPNRELTEQEKIEELEWERRWNVESLCSTCTNSCYRPDEIVKACSEYFPYSN